MNGNTVITVLYSIVRRPGAENSDWIGSALGSRSSRRTRTDVEFDCLRMASLQYCTHRLETRHETRGGPASLAATIQIRMTR